jgi:hypothetical protein
VFECQQKSVLDREGARDQPSTRVGNGGTPVHHTTYKGDEMKNLRLTVIIEVMVLVRESYGATVFLTQLHTSSTVVDTWQLKEVIATEADLVMNPQRIIDAGWMLRPARGPFYTCFVGLRGNCGIGGRPKYRQCTSRGDALQAFREDLVGTSIEMPKGSVPTIWNAMCYAGNDAEWRTRDTTNVVLTPASASCKSSNSMITLRGRVGERVRESTSMEIHCDSTATIRLTLPGSGLVDVGNGGVVRLSFQGTGQDVLTVSGTDPLVRIDGEGPHFNESIGRCYSTYPVGITNREQFGVCVRSAERRGRGGMAPTLLAQNLR